MGESFNTVQFLEKPFSFVDERVIFIPRRRRLEVQNTDLKFILVLEGTVDLLIDGHSAGRLTKGDILIVPQRCRQVYVPVKNAEERLHVMRIWFDFSTQKAVRPGTARISKRGVHSPVVQEIEFAAFLRHHFKTVRIVSSLNDHPTQDYVRQVRRESECRAPGYRFKIASYCRLFIAELARRLLDGPVSQSNERLRSANAPQPASWAVEHVKQFLYENCARSLTLREIAWEVKLSAEHLCRRFKNETGQTVFSYLRELRIESAKAYLVSSKDSITEIASRGGFSSATLFCRVFRKTTGQTPKAYRAAATGRISFQRTTLQPDRRIL